MRAHTPEPWKVEQDDHGSYVVCPRGLLVGDRILTTDTVTDDERDANNHRIVACVNACAGINPEAVPDLLAAAIALAGDPCGESRAALRAAIAKTKENNA